MHLAVSLEPIRKVVESEESVVNPCEAPDSYAYDGDRLVLRGGLSTHKHVFKSELKSD
jgi:hypothetical protein